MWLVPQFNKEENLALVIVKTHHSCADGFSWLSMNLQSDPGYDLSKIIKFPDILWYTRLMLRLMIPISAIRLCMLFATQKVEKNALRDPLKEKLTGNKHCRFSDKISF